jgi:hypothetical protein
MFLDKIMFGPHHHTPYDEDIELEEAGIDPETLTPLDADDERAVVEPPAKVTKP